jgi:hypothetical protein
MHIRFIRSKMIEAAFKNIIEKGVDFFVDLAWLENKKLQTVKMLIKQVAA